MYQYDFVKKKTLGQFIDIEKLLEIKPLKIVYPCQTRWLSLEAVVNHLLDLYESLKMYFTFVVNIYNIDTPKNSFR